MKSYDVVGYSYRADNYCLTDIVEKVYTDNGWVPPTTVYLGHEHNLDVLAQGLGIDRRDERTFDSDDFPKVILADQSCDVVHDLCGRCGIDLLDHDEPIASGLGLPPPASGPYGP